MFTMIKKFILIALVVAGLYGYHNYDGTRSDSLPSVAPREKITRETDESLIRVKDYALRLLPDMKTWPEPVQIMYHMVFMEETINPIRAKKDYLPLESLSTNLQHAIIAIEDHDFYTHSAISMDSIVRAIMINSSAGKILQGGSTITQQLVKNLFLTNEQTISRKMLEAMLAFVMESKYSKDEILELYLNSTYFGMDCYGANRACENLFNKAPIIMKLEEAALLAGLPNSPSTLDPYKNPQGAKKRQERVLEAMQDYGFITQNQCWKAKSADIYLRNGTIISHQDNMVL